jgi:hypothetical protein
VAFSKLIFFVGNFFFGKNVKTKRLLESKAKKSIVQVTKVMRERNKSFIKISAVLEERQTVWGRVARFFLVQDTKKGKLYQMTTKYTK